MTVHVSALQYIHEAASKLAAETTERMDEKKQEVFLGHIKHLKLQIDELFEAMRSRSKRKKPKHECRDNRDSTKLTEFVGQVPRERDTISINGKQYLVVSVLWNRWEPAVDAGNWDGELHAVVYVRELS